MVAGVHLEGPLAPCEVEHGHGGAVQARCDGRLVEADVAADVGVERLVDGLLDGESQEDADPLPGLWQFGHGFQLFGSEDGPRDRGTCRRDLLEIDTQRPVPVVGDHGDRQRALVRNAPGKTLGQLGCSARVRQDRRQRAAELFSGAS